MDGAHDKQPLQQELEHPLPDDLDVSLAHALQVAPFALIVTDLEGIVRRVVCPVPGGDAEAKQNLQNRHISLSFRDSDREFVCGTIQKVRESDSFSLERAPVWLHGYEDRPVYLSVSPLPVSRPENMLIAWHVARDRSTWQSDQEDSDRRMLQRMQVLEARAEAHRRRADRAREALQMARNSNRVLADALRSAREFQRQQSQTLKQMVNARDELLARSNELATSAVEARVAADEARLRLRVLADASWALTDLLDVDQTLKHLSDLMVPTMTECFVVDLVDTTGNTLKRASVACRDTRVQERIQGYPGLAVADLHESHPIQQVLSARHPTVLHELNGENTAWEAGAVTFLDHAAECGLTACIIAPLRSRDRTIGVLTLASTRAGHQYRPEDLQFAEDLALRTAQALDNAILFQDLVEATRDRDRYLSLASHELRSPLAVVSGFGSLLLRYIERPELDRERILNVGREMQQGIERLEVLTSNLLASAEVNAEASGLQRRRVDLVRVAQDVIDRTRVTLPCDQRNRIELVSATPIFGRWNLESMERAFQNVISNALKYSAPDLPVRVDVLHEDDHAVIRVRDQGIGMTEEEMADLFVPFARGKQARATAAGTGLGMYITQQIVRQHGGKVEVESVPGEGSLVTITLPLDLSRDDPPELQETIRRVK